MQYAAIIEFASLIVPGIIAGSKKIIKGNERYIIAIAAYFLLSRFAKLAAEQEVSGGIQNGGNNPNSYQNSNALATEYYTALNPFVQVPWLPNGTDEAKLYELAGRTSNYNEVFNAYRKKYTRNLTDDLISDFDPDEYQRFLRILNGR